MLFSFIEEQATVIYISDQPPVSSVTTEQPTSANVFARELHRPRSKTTSGDISDNESVSNESPQVSTSAPTNLHLFQSIKDLTHKELYRANPLGLLGKEVISATGTTHCPEPIPPIEDEDEPVDTDVENRPKSLSIISNKLTSLDETKPQQLVFPLNEEEKNQMKRRRSTLTNLSETIVPPYPIEYVSDTTKDDNTQPHLFSQPSPTTMMADFIPNSMTINVFEVFIYAWGVFAFFFDMVTDLVLAHAYYLEGAYWLFILTLMCVILPNLTLSIFSLVWYIDGSQLKAEASEKQSIMQYQTSINETSSSNDLQYNNCSNKNSSLVLLDNKHDAYCQTDDINDEDEKDSHISCLKDKNKPREEFIERKYFQISEATANILTWIIRIIILVLQLDLCLK